MGAYMISSTSYIIIWQWYHFADFKITRYSRISSGIMIFYLWSVKIWGRLDWWISVASKRWCLFWLEVILEGLFLKVYFWSFKIKDFNYCKVKILGKMIVIIEIYNEEVVKENMKKRNHPKIIFCKFTHIISYFFLWFLQITEHRKFPIKNDK